MATLSTFPRLEGLFELDQKGIDIRPTLLRVLTDQFVQSPSHSPEEEQQYTELALRLIDETDISARAAVAARLARHPAAPRQIILQLARDVLEVAEPVLRFSMCLTPADCEAIARERGPSYAEIIAQRGRVEAAGPETPLHEPPARTLASLPRSVPTSVPVPEAAELCELFFAAGSPERRLILITLDFVPGFARPPAALLQRADVWRLEAAALQHNSSVVLRELERALGVDATLARRIINDESGEPIVVAAKAMDIPADVVQRMLLFMNPSVGQSVDRVYELSTLYREISVEAARRMVDIWREAAPSEAERQQAMLWRDVAETARRALSEIARPSTSQRDTLTVQQVGAQGSTKRR